MKDIKDWCKSILTFWLLVIVNCTIAAAIIFVVVTIAATITKAGEMVVCLPVAENIALAKMERTFDHAQVFTAAEVGQLSEKIEAARGADTVFVVYFRDMAFMFYGSAEHPCSFIQGTPDQMRQLINSAIGLGV